MPRATVGDTSLTRSYIPKVSQTPGIAPFIAHFYKPVRDRCIHEGRVVDQLYYTSDHIDRCFFNIRLNCLYEINEPIVPRFVLDFYSQVTLQRDASRVILISFMIQNEFITLSLQQFGQILRIPFDGQVDAIERVMHPLALRQTRRPRSDRGKARHSVSSTSAHRNHGYSSHQGDDDEDDGASRSSTPSPTTYLKSLKPLDYQQYEVPTSSEQNDDLLFERQTDLLNQTQQMHKELRDDTKTPSPKHQLSSPSAPNAPSKTPSTKGTSSSSIDYTPKSPISSTSPSTNGYLNSPTSPPPRVPPPPPNQENASMDITLTLSPITPLDVQFDTPSPSPPIFGHPIPWNLLEAHGDSCLCCIHNRTLIFGLRDELQYMFSYIEYMLSQPPFSNTPPPSISPNYTYSMFSCSFSNNCQPNLLQASPMGILNFRAFVV
ncbi:hypothetical protein Tco_0317192 [Tanacetum coccineum]